MQLAPLTGLFGTNSSGKSSILQFLLMLKQTAESEDRKLVLDFGNENSKTNLGSFRDVIYGHDESNALDFSISWERKDKLIIENAITISNKNKKLAEGTRLYFKSKIIAHEKSKLVVPEMEYSLEGNTFGMKEKADKPGEYVLVFKTTNGSDFEFVRVRQRAWALPSPLKYYRFPDQVNSYYQNAGFVSDLQLALTNMLEGIYYLGPLREFPKRHYTFKGATPYDMGTKGEYVVDAILAAREKGKYISRGRGRERLSLEESVAFWLKKLGLIHSFKVERIADGSNLYQVKVKRSSQSSEVLITDVGFGVSQVLPVLVMCYYVPEHSTILLEQPEIHLHPSVQMGLADVFIDVMKNRDIQIILESHSEHLLNRLQRRLAENKVNRDKVSLYFCETGQAGSNLTRLNFDLVGNIVNWPKDFFGDQFGEVAARQEAQLNRKTTESPK